jgi:hypothetical protein
MVYPSRYEHDHENKSLLTISADRKHTFNTLTDAVLTQLGDLIIRAEPQ